MKKRRRKIGVSSVVCASGKTHTRTNRWTKTRATIFTENKLRQFISICFQRCMCVCGACDPFPTIEHICTLNDRNRIQISFSFCCFAFLRFSIFRFRISQQPDSNGWREERVGTSYLMSKLDNSIRTGSVCSFSSEYFTHFWLLSGLIRINLTENKWNLNEFEFNEKLPCATRGQPE